MFAIVSSSRACFLPFCTTVNVVQEIQRENPLTSISRALVVVLAPVHVGAEVSSM